MKNYLKIPILFTVFAISACRSHKTVEQSNYSANDSCEIQTEVRVHYLTNFEKTESISSCLVQDHLEFSDEAGEIRIYSNGEVTIKGIKSAYIMRNDTHKQSTTTTAVTDSITAISNEKSVKATDTTSRAIATNPTFSLIWIKITLFIGLIIVFILSIRSCLKRFFN
ncbi:MAG: hypothetical protein K2K25_12535 [Muribaculaceae bacterium]|nr:hypothetical protein [Muribaculaceae bacterium]